MQLSVNIQKAFFDGVKSSTADLICDVLVHKLVRYLKKNMVEDMVLLSMLTVLLHFLSFLNSGEALYYKQCKKTRLDRQVGSRCFV